MAAKGSIAKEQLIQQILKAFPNSFVYNDGKEVRINCEENGTPVQIKLTFTCAKNAVMPESEVANPIIAPRNSPVIPTDNAAVAPTQVDNSPEEPSQEEKERLAQLLSHFNWE